MSDRRPEPTNGSPPTDVRTDGGRDRSGADDSPPNGDGSGDESFDFTNGWTDGSRREDDADSEPLGDLARRLDEREGAAAGRKQDDDAFAELDEAWAGEGVGPSDADELFEEMDISDVDTEALWDSVLDDTEPDVGATAPDGQHDHGVSEEADREAGSDFDSGPDSDFDAGPGSGFDAGPDSADEPRETTVSKGSHCESCYFFTSPPEVGCTYDGSEIVEIVDSERFRVRNCPVVAGVVDTDGDRVGEGDEFGSEASD